MLLLMIGFGVFFAARALMAALSSLHGLPRSNEDWIWY